MPVKCLRAQSKQSTSEALEPPEHFLEQSRHLFYRRCKYPPGRGGPVGEEDEDDRGSIREPEQESSRGESVDDDDEALRLAKGANWEDVKRIIEHPSEDESEDEGEFSESRRLKVEVDRELVGLVLGSTPTHPDQEQEQPASTKDFRADDTEFRAQVAALHIEGDQHRRVEERVIYTTSWPE